MADFEDDPLAPAAPSAELAEIMDPVTLVGVPPHVAELCGACVQYVWHSFKVPLDFTPDTLSLVDHYLALSRAKVEERPEVAPLITRVVGAYFGEVVRRQYFGHWRADAPSIHDWQVCLAPVFLWFNPIGVAYDALFGKGEHDGPRSHLSVAPEDRDALDARLAQAPQIAAEEFFLLTTRLEALEIAVETLKLRQRDRGYGDVEFTLEDYQGETEARLYEPHYH